MNLDDLLTELEEIREAADSPSGPRSLKQQVTHRKKTPSALPRKPAPLGRPGTIGRKRFAGIGRRAKETPDQYRMRTGQCPPGYRFDGVHCQIGKKRPGEQPLPGQTPPHPVQGAIPPSQEKRDEQERSRERERKALEAKVPGFKNVAEFAQKESDEYFENEFCRNLFPDAFKTREDFIKSVAFAPDEKQSDWSKLHEWGGSVANVKKGDLDSVRDEVWGYNNERWLPKTGGDEKLARQQFNAYFAKLADACRQGDIPPVLVGVHIDDETGQETHHIIGGNTRAMICKALGKSTPVRQIPLEGRMRPVNKDGWFDAEESAPIAHSVLNEYRRLGLLTCGFDDALGLSTEPRTAAAKAKKVREAEEEAEEEAARKKKLAAAAKRTLTRERLAQALIGPDSAQVDAAPAEARRILARIPRDSWWREDQGEVALNADPQAFFEEHTGISKRGSLIIGTPHLGPHATAKEQAYFREQVLPTVVVQALRAVDAGRPVTYLTEDRSWWSPQDLAAHYPNETEQYQVAVALHDRLGTRLQHDSWDDDEIALDHPGAKVWGELRKLVGNLGTKAHVALTAYFLAQGDEAESLRARDILTPEAEEKLTERGLDPEKLNDAALQRLHELAFPIDFGKPHTELSAIVAAYVGLRQQHLITKLKAVEKAGGVAIVTPSPIHAWNLKYVVEESL